MLGAIERQGSWLALSVRSPLTVDTSVDHVADWQRVPMGRFLWQSRTGCGPR